MARRIRYLAKECPKCGGILDVDMDAEEAECPFCGFTFVVDDNLMKKITNINKTTNITNNNYYGDAFGGERKEKDPSLWPVVVLVLGLFFFIFLMGNFIDLQSRHEKELGQAQGMIETPRIEIEGAKAEDTAKALILAGFDNVEAVPIYDIVLGLKVKDGDVEDILINGIGVGDVLYSKYYDPESLITIKYHTKKKSKIAEKLEALGVTVDADQ